MEVFPRSTHYPYCCNPGQRPGTHNRRTRCAQRRRFLMNDLNVRRWTGAFGVASIALILLDDSREAEGHCIDAGLWRLSEPTCRGK